MNRYKISTKSYPAVKKFLKGQEYKKNVPTFARKFKADLVFKGNDLYYKDLLVIPTEKIDAYLRRDFYSKKSELPMSRDGAFHALKKRKITGITRARLMTFLKSQPAAESVQNALKKPKVIGGKKRKEYHFETDLVFIRRPDFIKISSKYESTIPKKETYIVSTCEVLTGLCRLSYINEKSETMPHVLRHIKSMAKELGIKDLSKYSGSSDKGEVKIKEIRKLLPWKFVKMGPSIEKSNQEIQKHLFRIARAGRGYKIPDLLEQVQKIKNNNFNSVHKQTPRELASEAKQDPNKEKTIVAQYNKKRRTHKSTILTKFQVGDYVRILLLTPGKAKGLAFKSYKGLTYSKTYQVKKATKQSIPAKYWVNRKWYTADYLKSSEQVDPVSVELVKQRDDQQIAADKLKEEQDLLKRKQKLAKQKAEKEARIKLEEEEAVGQLP